MSNVEQSKLDRAFECLVERYERVERELAGLLQRHGLHHEAGMEALRRRTQRHAQRQQALKAELERHLDVPEPDFDTQCRPTTADLMQRYRGLLLRA